MNKKQAIIFDAKDNKEFVEGEQTMDLLLHYAQVGIKEAEELMRTSPELFTEEEIMDFAAGKVVLAKAPDVLDDYKQKIKEFEQLHDKVQGVLSQCETVVEDFDMRQQGKDPEKERAKEKEYVEAGTIRYTADGDMIIRPQETKDRGRGRVNIELKKSSDY